MNDRRPDASHAVLLTLLAVALLIGVTACEKKEATSGADEATAESTAPAETPPGDEPSGDTATPDEPTPDEPPTDGEPPGAPAAGGDGPHVARMIQPADLKGDGSCIGEKTPMCDEAPEPPPCADGADAAAITVDELVANHTSHLGKQVAVRGTLGTPSHGACTEMACDRQCCNGCHGAMHVQATKGLPTRESVAFMFDGGPGHALMCQGDESGMCCGTRPPTGEVLATGMAEALGRQAVGLRNPTVCAL